MSIHYKILCEVKIFHEYYLTEGKGENIFGGATQAQRIDFLFKQFSKRVPHIGNHFDFVFPESMKKVFEGYHLRIVPVYSGFKLAVGCKKKLMPDGTFVFSPIVTLPEQLQVLVLLMPKLTVSQFSQSALNSQLRTKKYFSNDSSIGARTFPFLSLPVPVRDNSIQYEQGDVADTGPAIVLFQNNGAADPWKVLWGQGYSSSADSLLIPFRSRYSFGKASSVTEAQFVLKDSNGVEVKSIQKTDLAAFRSVSLDFTPEIPGTIKSIPGNSVNGEALYQLEVTGSNGFVKSHPLIFVDTMLIPESAEAIIDLRPQVANADFQMIGSDGNLPVKDALNNPKLPVFEIWLKSKTVFLKYRNDKGEKLKLSAETTGLLNEDGGVLVSENPVSLSYQPVSYLKEDSSFQVLPNPSDDPMIVIDEGKILAEMRVPVSKIFPLL